MEGEGHGILYNANYGCLNFVPVPVHLVIPYEHVGRPV